MLWINTGRVYQKQRNTKNMEDENKVEGEEVAAPAEEVAAPAEEAAPAGGGESAPADEAPQE